MNGRLVFSRSRSLQFGMSMIPPVAGQAADLQKFAQSFLQ